MIDGEYEGRDFLISFHSWFTGLLPGLNSTLHCLSVSNVHCLILIGIPCCRIRLIFRENFSGSVRDSDYANPNKGRTIRICKPNDSYRQEQQAALILADHLHVLFRKFIIVRRCGMTSSCDITRCPGLTTPGEKAKQNVQCSILTGNFAAFQSYPMGLVRLHPRGMPGNQLGVCVWGVVRD